MLWDLPMLPEIGPRSDLSVICADGTGKKPITHNAREGDGKTTSGGPMWSPDGRMLAYDEAVVPEPGRGESRVKIVDASAPDVVLRDAAGGGRGWSPSGREFLFSKGPRPSDLHVLDSKTGAIRNLTEKMAG
jgi:Tol biopolymer transport system component